MLVLLVTRLKAQGQGSIVIFDVTCVSHGTKTQGQGSIVMFDVNCVSHGTKSTGSGENCCL